MKLFTNKEEKILKQLLSCAVDQGEVLSLTSLHGFLYCLAIIPETVVPSEWLPCIFGEEMLEVENEQEADRLMAGLFAAYNRFINANENDELLFPFDMGQLKTADIDRVREWAYGFFIGTNLRPEVWGLPDEDDFIPEEEDEADSEEEKEIAACMMVLMGIAFPDKIPEMFDEDPDTEFEQARLKEQEARFFVLLPQVIETFQETANELRDEQRATSRQRASVPVPMRRAEKIGRNAPCPCGSGKKYKKCCDLN